MENVFVVKDSMDQHMDVVGRVEIIERNCAETRMESCVEDAENVSVVCASVTIVLMESSPATSVSVLTGRVLETLTDRCAEDTGGASVARLFAIPAGHVARRTHVAAARRQTPISPYDIQECSGNGQCKCGTCRWLST